MKSAKAIWNGWAELLLTEREAMVNEGRWEKEKARWTEDAKADFTCIHFLTRKWMQVKSIKKSAPENPPVKTLSVENRIVDFSGFKFPRDAWFDGATFSRDAQFDSATFSGTAWFDGATFSGNAWFGSATFSRGAQFDGATFSGYTQFDSATFSGNILFNDAIFQKAAQFPLVKFDQYAAFERARFLGPANFNAVRGDRAFTLEDAHFEHVPDFIQAHFEEAPRLDNVTVVGRMIPAYPALEKKKDANGKDIEPSAWEITRHWLWQKATLPQRFLTGCWRRFRRGIAASDDLHNIPARWRALKRLAIQAHDQDREHEFFAREIRSDRFLHDWPLPVRFWALEGWFSFGRFWAGVFYGLFSNYGRSILLPALWWLAGVAVATVFYLGESPGMSWERTLARFHGASSVEAYADTVYNAWQSDRLCYVPRGAPKTIQAGEIGVVGLSAELRSQTSAPTEALELALRDGFLILYGDADTAHRIYGCLYGVELYGGGTPVAIVPPQVAFWSALHKLYSAVMIFLFGLALRNMLKMK